MVIYKDDLLFIIMKKTNSKSKLIDWYYNLKKTMGVYL